MTPPGNIPRRVRDSNPGSSTDAFYHQANEAVTTPHPKKKKAKQKRGMQNIGQSTNNACLMCFAESLLKGTAKLNRQGRWEKDQRIATPSPLFKFGLGHGLGKSWVCTAWCRYWNIKGKKSKRFVFFVGLFLLFF